MKCRLIFSEIKNQSVVLCSCIRVPTNGLDQIVIVSFGETIRIFRIKYGTDEFTGSDCISMVRGECYVKDKVRYRRMARVR